MREGAPAPAAFDAVLLVHPASAARVAGLRLVERAAFTVVRAGAGRLLCIGEPPATPRLPTAPTTWVASPVAPGTAAWLTAGSVPIVIVDAAVVVDRATITALAGTSTDAVLEAEGDALLWRVSPPVSPELLANANARAEAPKPRAASPSAGHAETARRWSPPPGALLVSAHDAPGRTAAARALFASIGRPEDGWFTRLIDRRISRALTRLLLPTGVTPNAVTLGSITVGIAAGALFATGNATAALAGALLFLASTIIDGCDGELARLTFRESVFGARLDVVGDNVVHLFLFGGIAAGLYRRHPEPRIAVAGALLVVGVLAAMAAVYALFVRREPTPRQRRLFEAFASREFAYLLVVLTVADRLEWFLWASALGTYAFVAGLVFLRR